MNFVDAGANEIIFDVKALNDRKLRICLIIKRFLFSVFIGIIEHILILWKIELLLDLADAQDVCSYANSIAAT